MTKSVAVPLSELNPEAHGINFVNVFPQGLDEDRIRIHVDRIDRVAMIGNLGGITVSGVAGKTADTTPEINGIDQNGNGFASLVGVKRKQPLGEGVSVISGRGCTECADAEVNPNNGGYYHRAPTIIVMNTNERDKRLRESKKYPKGLLDPKGHADMLNAVLSDGLSSAARIRYRQTDPKHLKEMATIGSFGLGMMTMNPLGEPGAALMAGAFVIAGSLFGSEIVARHNQETYGTPKKDMSYTALMFIDRLFVARTIAKYARFVEVSK